MVGYDSADHTRPPARMTESTAYRLVALPMYAFLAVEGARAVEFLQGQLSCDMRDAVGNRALSGAWCSVKGRVVAHFLVWVHAPERVILRLRADLAPDTAAALSRYAALSRVRISAAEPGYRCAGLLGAGARARIATAGSAPQSALELTPFADGTVVVQRDAHGTLLELWEPTDATGFASRLVDAPPGTQDDWKAALIGQRLAEIQAATRDLFLPQMLGYDSDGTVSFRKGCYTGQEVIARAHYKGQVKRHLVTLHGEAGPCPAPGAELFVGERAAGNVVESAACADGRVAVMAVLAQDATDDTTTRARTAEGLELRRTLATPVL